MTKRLKRIVVICALTLISVLCFATVACGGKGFKVRFELNGGTPIAEIAAAAGEEIELPTPAEREGFSFEGWYDNAEFSGNSVTKVVVESDKTFYAKWEQLYKVSLELGKGTGQTAVYVKGGANLSEALKDHVPTLDGWQFGEWLMDGKAISASTVMPAEDITLTAHYKVGYTAHVFLQKTGLDGYDAGEDIKGYDYPAASYTPDAGLKGFELKEQTNETTHELSENPAQNVFTLYLDRKHYSANLFPNYPDSTDGEVVSIDFVYGMSVELPYTQFKASGYLLKGWTDITSDTYYASQVLEGLLRNGDGVAREDSFVLEVGESEDVMLYADWEQGYLDLLGGEDVIFHSEEDTRAILLRCDDYYEGTYIPQTGLFRFSLEDGSLLLEGKLFEEDKTFAYYDEMREGRVYHRYQVGLGIMTSERISLDSYNGLTYTQTVTLFPGVTEDHVSKGTYYMDEEEDCIVTYTSGEKAGTTDTVRLGLATVNGAVQRVFELRSEEDVNRGTMPRFDIIDNKIVFYPSAYLLTLDGFGTAKMQMGTSTANYFYVVDGDTFRLLMSDGTVYGTYRFVQFESVGGYMRYNASLDREFTNGSDILKLDGTCNAVYTHEGTTVEGYYSAIDSYFGGVIITMTRESSIGAGTATETYMFRVYTKTGDGDTILYTFETKNEGYAEYLYRDEEETHRAPLLVIDNKEEGLASLYGCTVTGTYVKVAEGKITENGKDGTQEKFLFMRTKPITPESAPTTDPYDLSKISSFVYSIGATTNYNVAYWYSVTMGEGAPTNFDEQYQDKTAGGTLTLVGGFAVYSKEGEETVAGVYFAMSSDENVIRITVDDTTYYFELNKTSKEFIALDELYGTKAERLPSGETDSTVTLILDGKGGATLQTTLAEGASESVKGTYTEGAETEFGVKTYHFVATGDNSKNFDFIVLYNSLGAYFTRSAGAKTYTAADKALLELDGYSYSARYTNAQGDVVTGRYILSEGAVTFTSDESTLYFDLKANDAFTVRGREANMYLRFENQYMDGTVFVFDGYGGLTVQRIVEGTEELEDIAVGKYEAVGEDGWILKYEENGTPHEISGHTGVYQISATRGYRVFKVEQEEIEYKYINEADWSVLIPDGHGDATLYTATGVVEKGTYLIIEDSETEHLLYYENNAGTDACLYRFDSKKGTIEKISSNRQYGYYTADLRSLRFTQYGFMIMDGATRYYYTVASNGSITVYERNPEAEGANEYGFVVTKDFGTIGADTIEFNGTTYINNDGYSIAFDREETTKNDYPISAVDQSTGTEIKGPLKKLSFQPTGSAEFSVTGAVEIAYTAADGTPATFSAACTVVREQTDEGYHLYVMISFYRFDIGVTYRGETGNTYTVNSMKYMRTLPSDRYLTNLALIYLMFGSSYANAYQNTLGEFTLVQEFNTVGEMTTKYLDVTFGEAEDIRQADGTFITKVHGDYEYDEERGIYSVTIQAEDKYSYNFYFGITQNRYFGQYSFILYACTRVQTFESNGYSVEVERTVATDATTVSVGGIWEIKLKQGGEEIDLESVYLVEDKIYCISRVREHLDTDPDGINTGKITGTVYYELVLVEEKKFEDDKSDEPQEGEEDEPQDSGTLVAVYTSATVTKREVKTVYCADGTSYVDIFTGEDQAVVGFVFGNAQYFVKESKYDDASKTYSVTTIGEAKYTIKIETNADGTEEATITLVSEE